MTKLKPCPFCGGENNIVVGPDDSSTWNVSCENNCRCLGPGGDSAQEAKDLWNCRSTDEVNKRLDAIENAIGNMKSFEGLYLAEVSARSQSEKLLKKINDEMICADDYPASTLRTIEDVMEDWSLITQKEQHAGGWPQFHKDYIAWSTETFPESTVSSALEHMKEEIYEIIADPSDLTEWADALMLFGHAFHRQGGSFDDILSAAQEKLDVLKTRSWGKPNERGYQKHVTTPPEVK